MERLLQKSRARATAPALYWGCYPMVPWAGRLAGGLIPTERGEVRLDLNLPPSAIHGLGFDKAWDVAQATDVSATLTCGLHGLGWPFGGRVTQTIALVPAGLALDLEIAGYTRPGPAGGGWHPWFARSADGDLGLHLAASEVLVVDRDLVPTGDVRPVRGIEDLRSGPPLGDRRLDHVYVRAKGPALLRWPDLDLAIEFDDTLSTVVVHTPIEGVCVEPQTMWPNAPALVARGVAGTGLRTLRPGERLSLRERWSWKPR